MKIRPGTGSDRDWATGVVAEHFATPEIVSRGVRHDTRSLPFLIAERGGERTGLAHFRIEAGCCEVVTLVSLRRRQGVGRQLLCQLATDACASGCRCIWAVTTNDNHSARALFEAVGYRLAAVHRGAVARARHLKPEIPDRASDGAPIEDELEYELALGRTEPAATHELPTRTALSDAQD
jgi:N-acetylglutamate synthase-like GNAT family acetyltransferase